MIRPAAREWDEREEMPWPIIQEAAKIGLYGLEAVAQFWSDPSGLTLPIVNEELFWGDAGIGMAMMGTNLAAAAIFARGRPSRSASGSRSATVRRMSRKVAAFCVSEPDAGSDVSALRTRARYDEARDEWVLNGQKAWATNGGIANVHVIVASVDRSGRARPGVVRDPAGQAGPQMGAKIAKHGMRASHTADVHLDDCRVPAGVPARRQGEARGAPRARAQGKRARDQAAMATFESSRPTVGAQALGIARAAYECALEYAMQRSSSAARSRQPGDRVHAGAT